MHAGIADDDDLVDPLREHARITADLLDVLVQETHDAGLELAEIAGVELGEGDARHQIAAEDGLGIEARHRRQLLAGGQLHEGGHHAGGAHVHGEAEGEEMGVARLHGENAPAERRHRGLALVAAQGLGQRLQHLVRAVLGAPSDGGEERFEIRGLVVLLGGKGDADECLVDARLDGHGHGRAGRPLGAEDLEAPVVHGRRDLHGDRVRHATLAGEAIALAHERVAELELVHDRGRGMSPETNLMRHDVQRPRPPQVASMSTPPPCAEARMVAPASTWRVSRAGSKVSATVAISLKIPLTP